MGELVMIHQPHYFSLEEAQSLLPVIKNITQKAVDEFIDLETRLNSFHAHPDQTHELERSIGELLNKWSAKILKLGCQPKGVWLVDFDNGRGYYCWRHGDANSLYFHGYHEGFAGRVAIN